MSQCECNVNASFRVRDDFDYDQFLRDIQPFLDRHAIEWSKDSTGSDCHRYTPDDGSEVSLDGGYLSFRLQCWSGGQGFVPAEVDTLLEVLNKHAAEAGALTIFNQDTPADAEDTVMARFYGPDEHSRGLAQVDYAMDQAATWLEGVLDSRSIAAIRAEAISRYENRLTAPSPR